jgi:mono/diheme cytochrome c family protein
MSVPGVRFRVLLILALTGWGSAFGFAAENPTQLPPAASRPVDFVTDIQPLLAAHCYSCHGLERQKADVRWDVKSSVFRSGDPEPLIMPGKSSESRVIHLVAGLEPDSLMPPKGEPLTAEEIGLLRAWIDQGAAWPETSTTDREPATTHWSFKPVTRPDVPAVSPQDFRIANPIDNFIFARLAENKLTPSREADHRTLIRRLCFDLIGLPPTPEEVREFEHDNSPGAYERLVNKLLGSPHYGERWARHWLDVVRFAETTGFEVNTPRPNAWPYRDYVIRAFNEDKPYDQFIREQLVGDLLGEDAATGFLVAGPDDLVKSPDPVLTSNQRADELHDIVSTTGSAFLGLTVGCARCHNHKFDPIPQTDYFAIKAVFEGVKHGERKLKTAETEARDKELAKSRGRLVQLDARLAEFEPLAQVGHMATNSLRAPVNARQNSERVKTTAARRLRFTVNQTTDAEPCIDELEVYTVERPAQNIALASAGTKATASSVFPNSEIHRLEHINDGKHGNRRSWISNERGKGWVELEFAETVLINRIVWGRDREQKFADRLATDYRIEVATGSNDWRIVASAADRLPYKPGAKEQPVVSVAGLSAQQAAEVLSLQAERKELESRIAELAKVPMLYAGTFTETPPPTRRYHRGDPMQEREEVLPGALGILPMKFDADIARSGQREEADVPNAGDSIHLLTSAATEPTQDQERRLALARWITDPANPLTARVMVNRLWQYHFGEGLVSTPSDFGANGARPTHPELLDWLASELIQPTADSTSRLTPHTSHPWSIKHIHRLIVTSATYRQASDARTECVAVDAGSRLLWRLPPRRLEAEPIRDQMLAVSGKLDLQMGGPGFSFFEPNDNYVRVYAPRQEYGPETFRRMVYGTLVRQRPDGVFGVFDCPDGGQIAPKRTRSTTPLQALNLLNSSFIMQQSGFLAERLEQEAGADAKTQVRRAFALAFQREPDRAELRAALEFIQEHGLPVFCRALFNANEFVYLF